MNENQIILLDELEKRLDRMVGYPLAAIYDFANDFEKNFNPMASYEHKNAFKAYFSMTLGEEIEVLKAFTEFVTKARIVEDGE